MLQSIWVIFNISPAQGLVYLVVHPEHDIVRPDFLKLEEFDQRLEEAQHVAVWLETATNWIRL